MVDKAVSSSYEYLVGKLGQVFPQLRAGSFSLTWTDGDGDKVGGVIYIYYYILIVLPSSKHLL